MVKGGDDKEKRLAERMREGQAVLPVLECLISPVIGCGCSVVLFSCFPEYSDDVCMYFLPLFRGFSV